MPLIMGMIKSRINTAAKEYKTPALLKASLQAPWRVVFVIVVQSVTLSKLLSNVIAMKIPTTIIAILII